VNSDAAAEDVAAFQEALRGVTPLRHSDRVPSPRATRGALIRSSPQEEAPEALALSSFEREQAAELTEFVRPGVPRTALRKLRKTMGGAPELDLHGMTSDAAFAALVAFLESSARDGERCARVIHGKGLRSRGGESVLRTSVRAWLVRLPMVMGFCEAPPNAGGSGAVLVLLAAQSRNT
jgi:DNA-nicking Smr family endonuclease